MRTSTAGRPRLLTQNEIDRALALRAAYRLWMLQRPQSLRAFAREIGVDHRTLTRSLAHLADYKQAAPLERRVSRDPRADSPRRQAE